MHALELYFTDGLESTSYQTSNYDSSNSTYEITWDTSKQIKKVSINIYSGSMVGIQLLDEKDDVLVKWDGLSNNGDWQPAKEIPDGFNIIGVFGDTRKNSSDPQFGFLIWNAKPSN